MVGSVELDLIHQKKKKKKKTFLMLFGIGFETGHNQVRTSRWPVLEGKNCSFLLWMVHDPPPPPQPFGEKKS